MSGEQLVVYGTPKVLESGGAAITNNSIVLADDATYDVAADGLNYPDALFVATFLYGTAPIENSVLALYARPLLIDGTNSTDIPEATRTPRLIGYYAVNNVTTLQAMELLAFDVPRKAEYYLHNSQTGQTVTIGWTLRVIPRTYKVG